MKLVNILGQESYIQIKVEDGRGKVLYMKVKITKKELFLKTIQKHLFYGFGSRYSIENTIVVDDNPVKHVLNPSENVILPKSSTFVGIVESDTYFMDMLLP